jgi:valyl-tRNA synthetase
MRFDLEGGGYVEIATTRPELLPACVGVAAHPSDKRYQPLFGKRAVTPLFRVPVPIIADEAADPEKGTGMAMICTFGDGMDVEWWRNYSLPLRQIIGLDGKLLHVTFGSEGWESLDPEKANRHYGELAGLFSKKAQKRIVELMAADGVLLKDPEPIRHTVRFFEKGDHPLEIIPTPQWFIRILDKKEALLEQGRKIQWHPEHMRIRYERWVEGLNQDWLVSRQRYFGVPFPVWFRLDENGEILHDKVLTPNLDRLPIDPSSDLPPGYSEEERDKPNGFTAELDVLDTWATSSLTPQLCSLWELDPERHEKLFPMDLRPQSHEIIRTWAFYTIVKAYLHEKKIPWKNVVISGWILDPDRKKMSKSQGNVVTPHHLLEQYSADAVRYWAARARLGVDTAYDESVFAVGRRLTTKIFNASKFVLSHLMDVDPKEIGPERIALEIDRSVIDRARGVIKKATEAFDRYEYAVALQQVEDFFWKVFCDDYVEVSKARSYEEGMSEGKRSALATLRALLSIQLRMFAPFLPYLTEEIWQWYFADGGKTVDSIHLNRWPTLDEPAEAPKPKFACTYDVVSQVLESVRGAKSRASVSMKHPVASVHITGSPNEIASLQGQVEDVKKVLSIEACTFQQRDRDGEPLDIEVKLANRGE